jgi:hypothetical protein
VKILRRFFKRLSCLPATRQDEERLREEIEEHLALQTPKIFKPVSRPPKRAVKPY